MKYNSSWLHRCTPLDNHNMCTSTKSCEEHNALGQVKTTLVVSPTLSFEASGSLGLSMTLCMSHLLLQRTFVIREIALKVMENLGLTKSSLIHFIFNPTIPIPPKFYNLDAFY